MAETKPRKRPIATSTGLWTSLALLVVLAGVGLTLGLPCYRQLQLIEEIETMGGEVSIASTNLDWLLEWVGEDWIRGFDRIEFIGLGDSMVNDDWLANIEGQTSLEILMLSETEISDAGLEQLGGLNSLESLDLSETQISDAGLEHLSGLSSLKLLFLSGTQIRDLGIKRLQQALPGCDIVY